MFEALESRRLMSVSVALQTAVLSVTSDDSADQIKIEQVGGTLSVSRMCEIVPNVNVWKLYFYTSANNVSKINVNLNGGDDSLTIGDNVASVAIVNGGAGNDTIRTGGCFATVNAGDGNDLVAASTGTLYASGGTGNDTLLGGSGDDSLNGDAGNDSIVGGAGKDYLNGGSGNDRIDARDGIAGNDTVVGGTGLDFARVDRKFLLIPFHTIKTITDSFTGIEQIAYV